MFLGNFCIDHDSKSNINKYKLSMNSARDRKNERARGRSDLIKRFRSSHLIQTYIHEYSYEIDYFIQYLSTDKFACAEGNYDKHIFNAAKKKMLQVIVKHSTIPFINQKGELCQKKF